MRENLSRIAALAFMLLIPFSAFAAQEPVAGMTVSRSGVDFGAARVDHEALQLTVTDPNGEVVLTREYRGQNISLRNNDLGRNAIDGHYGYEIRVVPRISASVRAQLAATRAANDEAAGRAIQRANGLANPIVQSGSFQILNGAFVPNTDTEPGSQPQARTTTADGEIAAAKSTTPSGGRNLRIEANDQVIPDDLIVQSSICAGFDCVDGESFGVDTLRLKENNLRIHFDDTSTSAGFANNDWRLFANDQPSGGANKFWLEDSTNARNPFSVEAAAPTNAIYVDSTGNIGFQNSNPGLDLHLTVTDTPALRLEQTNAGGFTAQTWDIGANEANFFVRDLTGGSRLSFRIRPGAPTSSLDISADGDIGVGTASPNANTRLDLQDSTQVKARIALTGQEYIQASTSSTDGIAFILGVNRTGNRQLFIGTTDAIASNGTNKVIRIHPTTGAVDAIFTNGSATNLILNQTGGFIGIGTTAPTQNIQHSSGATLTGGNWTNACSREVKQNIADLDAKVAMDAFKKLNPVTYQYKQTPNDNQVGFIAEDVPELVATSDHKGLSAMDVVALLTKVVQEQQKTIDSLNERLDKIEKQ